MSLFLLDTNVCIEFLRRRNSGVVQRMKALNLSDVCVSATVSSELYYGVFKGGRHDLNLAILEEFLAAISVLPYDHAAARIGGRLRAELAVKGTPIGPNDLQIAATALSKDLIVVTHNVREFSRIPGLNVEDWHV